VAAARSGRATTAASSAPSWWSAWARCSASGCAPSEGGEGSAKGERKGWGPPVGAGGMVGSAGRIIVGAEPFVSDVALTGFLGVEKGDLHSYHLFVDTQF
jgi:hypothetical protein